MKYPKVFLLLLCALSLCVSTVFAAGGWNWQDNMIRVWIPLQTDVGGFSIYDFYVIGWSKTGYIAVMQVSTDSGMRGGELTSVRVFIQNLVNDQIVFDWSGMKENVTLKPEQAWIAFSDQFQDSLKKFEILSGSASLEQFPVMNLENSGEAVQIKVDKKNGDDDSYSLLKSVRVTASKKDGRCAVILNENNPDYWADFMIAGYIRNPFEPRIAVVGIVTSPPFENEYSYQLKLIGCHLNKGFSIR